MHRLGEPGTVPVVSNKGFEARLAQSLRGAAGILPGSRVGVGVSGGADSTGLLAGLVALVSRGEFPLELAVVHVDHGLRGEESARDAQFVESLARRWQLPFFLHRVDLGPTTANLEARARQARITALRAAAGAWRARWIAVAHTAEDQAETFLMRLARGGGVGALSGMTPLRTDGLWRPLLQERREDVRDYLRSRDLVWVEDSSNQENQFFRNRIRRALLPEMDRVLDVDVAGRLSDLTAELRVESELAEAWVENLLAGLPRGNLPLRVLGITPGAAGRIVHHWLARLGVSVNRRQVRQILRVAAATSPSGEVDLVGGDCVRRRYDGLFYLSSADVARIGRASRPWSCRHLGLPGDCLLPNGTRLRTRAELPQDEDRRASSLRTVLPEKVVPAGLHARAPSAGDRLRLPAGTRKLSDLCTDLGVPRDLRAGLTVVLEDNEIVWVPGVSAAGRWSDPGKKDGLVLIAEGDLLQDLNGCRKKP